jgi:hypothetical protein
MRYVEFYKFARSTKTVERYRQFLVFRNICSAIIENSILHFIKSQVNFHKTFRWFEVYKSSSFQIQYESIKNENIVKSNKRNKSYQTFELQKMATIDHLYITNDKIK